MSETQENDQKCPDANEVEVCTFRHIVLWPLVLGGEGLTGLQNEDAIASLIREIAKAVRNERGWEAVPDLADHVKNDPGKNNAGRQGLHHPQTYAEIVYFHDFVQRTLFRKPRSNEWPEPGAPILLLRNERLKRIRVDLRGRDLPLEFDVDRLNLYLFTTGVAILALELALPATEEMDGQPSLADIQAFMDQFRRWHAPYFDEKGQPGLVAESITLHWAGEEPRSFPTTHPNAWQTQDALLDNPDRAVRPFGHWLEILPTAIASFLASATQEERLDHRLENEMRGLHWRSISDERMHTMNFILVPPHRIDEIRKSDWVRLCFADPPDKGWPYLICDGDWKKFREKHVFDWFWQDGTRQMFSAFNHVIVAANCWFPQNVLVHHFRRHYFQMNLMALFEQASLLAFSSRISGATAIRHDDDAAFRESIIAIRRDFLHFVHEFRFTGMSSQMQPRAMFDMMRCQMGLHELFHDVEDELRTGTDYLLAIDSRERTETAGRLNIIAAIGVILGLVMAFASTKGFEFLRREYFDQQWFFTFSAVMLAALTVSSMFAYILLKDSPNKNAKRTTVRIFVALFVIFVLMALFTWLHEAPLPRSG